MPAATASMTPVEIQPMTHCGFGNFRPAVMVLLVVISMTRTMIGPAQRPLITALQKSALMGLMWVRFSASPRSVTALIDP